MPQEATLPVKVGRGPYEFRGGSRKLLESQATEVVLAGAAGTGKSVASLTKLHWLAELVPGFRGLILRKTRESLTESGLVTFEERVLPPGHAALATGGQRRMRQAYRYPNGSQITVGGMDKPSRIMSTEYDVVYVQEAIELAEPEWEAILTRLRNGRLPYQQLVADTNPDAPTHWLKRRADAGKLQMFHSVHEDNPALYDPAAGWTPAGKSYLAKLDALSGPRLQRLRWGRWVQAEGVVFDEYRPAVHLIDRFEVPLDWERYWAVDFGYTMPFVCQFWASDHDGRLYRYKEVYRTKRLVEDHARHLLRLFAEEVDHWTRKTGNPRAAVEKRLRPKAVVCDHDAEDRATLTRHLQMGTTPARKAVKPGIEAVQSRLRVQPDGKPRLYLLRDSLAERDSDLDDAKRPCCLEEELDCYVWDEDRDEPLKENDHSCDALRYLVSHVQGGVWEAPTAIPATPAGISPGAREGGGRLRFGGDGGRAGRLFGR